MTIRVVAAAALVVAFATSCGGEAETAPAPPECHGKSRVVPCTSARAGVEYPLTLYVHCGVEWVFVDGRYWVVDPPQPIGANSIAGVVQVVDDTLVVFRAENGQRYAFAPAPPDYEPPPCY